MKTETIVAILVGIVIPIPGYAIFYKMVQKETHGLVSAWTVIVGIVLFIAICTWTLPVLSYAWDWFCAALHSTPVKL